MSDDVDSLFGSRPSSPVAATNAGRSARPQLALPGLALPTGIQNVGTIALPGLPVSIEQPATAPCPRLPLTPATPSTPHPTPIPRTALRLPLKRAPVKPAPEQSLKRKRLAPDLDLPGPGEPLPPNLLRNHNSLLGTAGRVAGLKLPEPTGSGSSRSDPVVIDDDSVRSSRGSVSGRNAARPGPNTESGPTPASRDPLARLQRNPNFIAVLRGLLAHTTMQRRSYHSTGRPPPPKKRRLSRVPSGAQDWDHPYPFPRGEGPEKYDETWSQNRGAKLVKDLVTLVSEAVNGSQTEMDVDANPVATDGQEAIATSVNNWLDTLRNTRAPSVSGSADAASPVPPSDSFEAFEGVDSLQSLMALYDKQSDESLFSTLFGADFNTFDTPELGGSTSASSHALPPPPPPMEPEFTTDARSAADVPDSVIDPELLAISRQQVASRSMPAPWPTPESSLHSPLLESSMFGQDEDDSGMNMPASSEQCEDTNTFEPHHSSTTVDPLADPAAFEDAIKSLLASMPALGDNSTDSMMDFPAMMLSTPGSTTDAPQNLNLDQPPIPHGFDVPTPHLPLTPVSLATPTFASPRHSITSLVDPATLEPIAQPSQLAAPTVPPTPSVADPPPSVSPTPAPVDRSTSARASPAPPTWTNKVEKKSALLAQALAHRARLQDELDRTQHDIWGCTVEDGVMHRLLYPPK